MLKRYIAARPARRPMLPIARSPSHADTEGFIKHRGPAFSPFMLPDTTFLKCSGTPIPYCPSKWIALPTYVTNGEGTTFNGIIAWRYPQLYGSGLRHLTYLPQSTIACAVLLVHVYDLIVRSISRLDIWPCRWEGWKYARWQIHFMG